MTPVSDADVVKVWASSCGWVSASSTMSVHGEVAVLRDTPPVLVGEVAAGQQPSAQRILLGQRDVDCLRGEQVAELISRLAAIVVGNGVLRLGARRANSHARK